MFWIYTKLIAPHVKIDDSIGVLYFFYYGFPEIFSFVFVGFFWELGSDIFGSLSVLLKNS